MVAITLLHYTSILSMDMLRHATMGLFEAMVSEVRLLPKKVWTLMFGASNGKFCGSVLSGRNDSVISTGPKLKVQLPESWSRFPPSKSCEYRCMDSIGLLIILALSYFRGPALSSLRQDHVGPGFWPGSLGDAV
jgi:hypothetical protein